MEQEQQPTNIKNPLEDLPSDQEIYEAIASGTLTIDQFKEHQDHLRERERNKDPMIEGLWGVRGFEQALQKYLEQGVKGVLIAIDVDDFKRFNDTQGHPAGDDLLKLTAELLKRYTRTQLPTLAQQERRVKRDTNLDIVARAGDEFLVLMAEADIDDAIDAAKRVRRAIAAEAQNVVEKELPFEQTMSLGLTVIRDDDDVKSLRQRGDLALYKAKEGKGGDVIDSLAVY